MNFNTYLYEMFQVIEGNPNTNAMVKAHYRRGESLIALNEHELAKKDFLKVIELEPDNTAAENKIKLCNHHLKLVKAKERKMYANMFDKVSTLITHMIVGIKAIGKKF